LLAQYITEKLHIPTIGIGAGIGCDGQVQVFHDILGLFDDFVPRHTKQFSQIGEQIKQAIEQYRDQVHDRQFPTTENSFAMSEDVIKALRSEVD